MKLYFCKPEEVRLIAEPKDEDEAWEEIKKFCDDRNYTIPYVRMWEVDGVRHYDVGSWSEHFELDLEVK